MKLTTIFCSYLLFMLWGKMKLRQERKMKIITWNVNGLRSVLRKGALDNIPSKAADILCLQEIKSKPEQLNTEDHHLFEDYHALWNPAEKLGYSGVATFARVMPLDVSFGLGLDDFDREGRIICSKYPEFLLFNIYFPNGQRDHGRLAFKLKFYAHLLDLCDNLHAANQAIILCGDFNTAHKEIDLKNPKQNAKTSGFLPEERAWIDLYLEHGFVDAYRRLYPRRVQYTWWTYVGRARERNTGWRLDYFLVSENLMPRVQDVVIYDDIPGSDHCPVELFID